MIDIDAIMESIANRKDVECPYCGHGQNIDHDDGQGYEEDELHQQECSECEKTFGYRTTISFYYEPEKVPCFNECECEFKERNRRRLNNGITVVFHRCIHCGEEKQEQLNGK